MAEDAVNDDTTPGAIWMREPDPCGQAAMLLVESLIHGLVARSVISVPDAVEIVDVATEVKAQIGVELGDSPPNLRKSLELLDAIGNSLRQDIRTK
jgi:hypothetical protein